MDGLLLLFVIAVVCGVWRENMHDPIVLVIKDVPITITTGEQAIATKVLVPVTRSMSVTSSYCY